MTLAIPRLLSDLFRLSLVACLLVLSLRAEEDRPTITLAKTKEGFVLVRGGKPFLLNGAGVVSPDSLPLLREAGGNAIRTWGVQAGTRALLDEAQKLGLAVCFGLWLQKEGPGFSFRNPEQFRAEMEQLQREVMEFKDHPAIVLWGVGNELEGFDPRTQAEPLVWKRIQAAAALVKAIDPSRPTMTTLAEIGGEKVRLLHKYCPAIDIVGINSYRGAPTLPGRYRAAGGSKPYILTEYGPEGTWEVERSSWEAPYEPTSTEKAKAYRSAYIATTRKDQPGLCLGSFAFLWGHKQELTATWYGMMLPDGSRLEAMDVMHELWTGTPPQNQAPKISSLRLQSKPRVKPKTELKAKLSLAGNQSHENWTATWVVRQDSTDINLGGAAEAELPEIPGCIQSRSLDSASVRAPEKQGPYRLFVVIRDGKGRAATANVPFLVEP